MECGLLRRSRPFRFTLHSLTLSFYLHIYLDCKTGNFFVKWQPNVSGEYICVSYSEKDRNDLDFKVMARVCKKLPGDKEFS